MSKWRSDAITGGIIVFNNKQHSKFKFAKFGKIIGANFDLAKWPTQYVKMGSGIIIATSIVIIIVYVQQFWLHH